MIHDRIKSIRTTLRIKQIEMAKILEMNPSAISQMESGRTKPSLETLIDIAEKLKVDLHWLITGEGRMFNKPDDPMQQSKGWDKLQKMMNAKLEEIVQARQDMLDSESISFDVTGEIAAGEPIDNFGDTVDVVTVRRSMISGKIGDYVALRINGRSMEPDIRNNDVVLIRQNQDWQVLNGKVCAVRIDGAITLKKMMLDDAKQMIVLVPLNENFQPILVNPENHKDVALLGSLFYLFRILR
ncbi:MAG: S24 family peptidase [Candidatus Cloacimonas sp.]|jgi:SOS-response transcriptional repressor LexA|nr:S24 family peptidase [Candidatus Cloacimonas sp.]